MLKDRFFWLTVSTALILVACGPQNAKIMPNTAQLGTSLPTVGVGGASCTDLSAIPAASLALILGRYESANGVMGKSIETGLAASQPYTITLSQQTYNNRPYANILFQSEGELGKLSFQGLACLSIGGGGVYNFVSARGRVPNLSSGDIAALLTLSFYNNQFYPAQSQMNILDCGFSQDTCIALSNVSFARDLIKR